MVVLKKIKASTLMETLVATVLIVVIFMMTSFILNGLFSSTMSNNTRHIEAHINQLNYLQQNKNLKLPYDELYGNWSISVLKRTENNNALIEFEAINIKTKKKLIQTHHETQY